MKKFKNPVSFLWVGYVAFILSILVITMSSCKKYDMAAPNLPEQPQQVNKNVSLHFSLNGIQQKGLITSGQTVSGDTAYYFSFWLSPATGDPIAMGIWTISNSNGVTVYQSATAENGIDFKPAMAGTYTLGVTGNLAGQAFSYSNITVIATGAGNGNNPGLPNPCSPVRLHSLQVSGGTASVGVVISKREYQAQSSANWFHLFRINGQGFTTNQAVTSETDSVRFTLSFPAVNQTYVEFNAGFHDGSTGGMWLTPGAGSPPSILYTAGNIPYNYSSNYFGFRFHVNGNLNEIRTYNGTLLLSTGGASIPIPGNQGDGPANNYQVRNSGYIHYFKSAIVNPTFRYRIGNTSYTELPATSLAINNEYFQVNIPAGTMGEMRFQYGSGTGANFVPASSMANSMYYEQNSGELVKNL